MGTAEIRSKPLGCVVVLTPWNFPVHIPVSALGDVLGAGKMPTSGADAWDHFAADHVLVHGRVLAVVWDQSGTVYGRGAGLRLWVDGVLKATAPNLDTPLSVSL